MQWSLTAGPSSTHLPDSLKYQPTKQPTSEKRICSLDKRKQDVCIKCDAGLSTAQSWRSSHSRYICSYLEC